MIIMNCKDFKENIAGLFDTEITDTEMLTHIAECESCRQYYEECKETVDLLTPKKMTGKILIPDESPQRQSKKQKQNPKKEKPKKIKMIFRRSLQIAASLIILFTVVGLTINIFFTEKVHASEVTALLNSSSAIINKVGNFSMKFKVRTYENENFAYINADLPFVNHYIDVANVDGATIWRLSKENGRTVINNGKKQFLWNNDDNKGYIFFGDSNIAEDFFPLIYPSYLFTYELGNAQKSDKDSYVITTTDSTITLTVTSTKEGNPYPLFANRTISISDNVREYTFDKDCGLLKDIRFWIIIDGKRNLILESESISYNQPYNISDIKKTPSCVTEWVDLTRISDVIPKSRMHWLKKEKPEKAVKRILNSIFSDDISEAEEALVYYNFNKLKKKYKGCKIVECGKPFNSDGFASTFVNVRIKTSNGNIRDIRVAVRNDNDKGIWLLDGGL